ncbi:MAG: hypothetical protein JXB10_02955 [Pirellulales bacterium]|nr:hypothetical protein [Pirellulales bacterium]
MAPTAVKAGWVREEERKNHAFPSTPAGLFSPADSAFYNRHTLLFPQ